MLLLCMGLIVYAFTLILKRNVKKLRCFRATTTACRGKLRRVRANYGVSSQIMECQGKLRCVGANCVVLRQITSCRDKLRRVGANYGVSGQITACRGK